MNTSFERSANASDEWYTPREIIEALGEFDLDPCAPQLVLPTPMVIDSKFKKHCPFGVAKTEANMSVFFGVKAVSTCNTRKTNSFLTIETCLFIGIATSTFC